MTEGKNQDQEESHAIAKWEDSGVPAATVGIARAMVASGYFSNVQNVAQAIVKVEMGKSLGVSPVEAMQYLHIFNTGGGNRTNIQLGYPLVGALIQRSGKYHFDVRERTDTECVIDFYRILTGGSMNKLGTSRFTIEQAKRAGLITKDIWKSYPEVMLYARALTHGAKAFCPEILGGAGIRSDEPYIEAEARLVNGDGTPVIEEPPEGFGNHWARFWAFAKGDPPDGLGMSEDEVHKFFGVPSLKESADNIMKNTRKPEAEVVAEFELALREGQSVGHESADEERWRQDGEAAADGDPGPEDPRAE